MKKAIAKHFFITGMLSTCLFFFSCTNKEKDQEKNFAADFKKNYPSLSNLSDTEIYEAANSWRKIEALSETYINDVKQKSAPMPIDEKEGYGYIEGFRKRFGTNAMKTLAMDVSSASVAYFAKYIVDSGKPFLQANFGIYDLAEVQARGGQTGRLTASPDKIGRLTLVFGPGREGRTTGRAENYAEPFVEGNLRFFDNWQGLWP